MRTCFFIIASRLGCLFSFMLVPALNLAHAHTPEAKTADRSISKRIEQIQKHYSQRGDMKASFEQIYQDAMTQQQRVEQGCVFVKQDGRLRFTYLKPERKDFIFDGNRAYFYEPENAQVTVFDHFARSPAMEAMHWLFGQGHLGGLFVVRACDANVLASEHCPKPEPFQTQLCLFPSSPQPSVQQIILHVERKNMQISQAILLDALNNQTIYRLHNVTFGKLQDDVHFDFTIPPGVSLLQAPGGEAS